jgi:O-methyltransferase
MMDTTITEDETSQDPGLKIANVRTPEDLLFPSQAVRAEPTQLSLLNEFATGKATLTNGRIEMVHVGHIRIGVDERSYIFMHPSAELTFKLPGAALRLSFGVALHPDTWGKMSPGGCEFLVYSDDELVFRLPIDPVRNPVHQGWLDASVELPPSSAAQRTLALATCGVGGEDYRWALWSDPVVSLDWQKTGVTNLTPTLSANTNLAGLLSNIAMNLQRVAVLANEATWGQADQADDPRSKDRQRTGPYEVLKPEAEYAPWLEDTGFEKAYQTIQGFTMVHPYKCYDLWSLVGQSAKVPGALIEIGVWRGGTGALIARKAQDCQIPDRIYLCDTFKGVVKAGEMDVRYKGGEHADTSREIVEDLLFQRMGLSTGQIVILEGIFPDDTEHLLQDSAFRFCHIDVDAYQSAKDVLTYIWPRMSIGGIVVFDDYGFAGTNGVTRLVNDWLNENDLVMIYNLNGHAVFVKIR